MFKVGRNFWRPSSPMPLIRALSTAADMSGLCPGRFWVTPMTEFSQPIMCQCLITLKSNKFSPKWIFFCFPWPPWHFKGCWEWSHTDVCQLAQYWLLNLTRSHGLICASPVCLNFPSTVLLYTRAIFTAFKLLSWPQCLQFPLHSLTSLNQCK